VYGSESMSMHVWPKEKNSLVNHGSGRPCSLVLNRRTTLCSPLHIKQMIRPLVYSLTITYD
jgi:hypothetical protein